MTAWPEVDAPGSPSWTRESHVRCAGWTIDTLSRRGSSADVRGTPATTGAAGLVHARVADDLGAGDGSPAATDVLLHPDGRADVVRGSSPPVLLVGDRGSRLVPAMAGRSGDDRLAPGDLLLVCSSDALEHLPAGVGAVLGWDPRSTDADRLLELLMDDTDHGAALLARYTPTTTTIPGAEDDR